VQRRHITYFSWLDPNAFTMESGKYFEVVGHVTFDIDQDHQITQFQQEWVNTSRCTRFFIILSLSLVVCVSCVSCVSCEIHF
jgi:hypothetical protein